MGSRFDKKTKTSDLEREVARLRLENERLAGERWVKDDTALEAYDRLTEALSEPDGYWRIGRARDGNFWARFKWTTGSWAGCYVLGGHNNLAEAIMACSVEYDKVLSGKRSPLTDKGFKR